MRTTRAVDNFKKMNAVKAKESRRDEHLKWINHYSSDNFGIFVECTKCKKWRKTFQYSEPHEVPEKWYCSSLTLENGKKGSCDDPEEEDEEPFLEYYPGSVVWAKLEGYPWWPAMVDGDPDTDEYFWIENSSLYYKVTFLDKKPTHTWILDVNICPFLKPPKVGAGFFKTLRQNKYAKAISKAKERAEAAMEMTIKDRLQTYSFVHSYKGRWAAVSNSEEWADEEHESSDVEDGSSSDVEDGSYKAGKEAHSTTDTADERIEKEHDSSEEIKLISKNSDVPVMKKEAHHQKYLKSADDEVFHLMKNKKPENSSKINKPSSNAKYETWVESVVGIANTIQGKEAKGIKRKSNKKMSPRKQKKLDETTHGLTKGILNLETTDSVFENNESSSSVIVPIRDCSKSMQDSGEKVAAKDKTKKKSTKSFKGRKIEKQKNISSEKSFNSFRLTSEDVSEYTDESSLEVSKPVENESLDESDESNQFEQEKLVKTSSVPKEKSSKREKIAKAFNKQDSNSKIFESDENESYDEFDERNHSQQKKFVQTSSAPEKNNAGQKKSRANIQVLNNKTEVLKENTTPDSQVSPKSNSAQNVSDSTSKIKYRRIIGWNKLTKDSNKKFIPVVIKKNELPQQPKSSISSSAMSSTGQNHEVVVGTGNKNNEAPRPGNLVKKRKH